MKFPINSVYHKATADNETFTTLETRLTYARLTNLTPNSQHIIYVVAIGTKGESLPSETLVAWTDPALPALVDVCEKLIKINSSMSINNQK